MTRKKTHYDILEIDSKASSPEIAEAFRLQAAAWHPDRHSANYRERSEARMKLINEAYRILRDPKLRADYDGQLARRSPNHDDADSASSESSQDQTTHGEGMAAVLNLDGVYCATLPDGVLSYLRFYSDGSVLHATSRESDVREVMKWLDRTQKGRYYTGKAEVGLKRIEIRIKLPVGYSVFLGQILDRNQLSLKVDGGNVGHSSYAFCLPRGA